MSKETYSISKDGPFMKEIIQGLFTTLFFMISTLDFREKKMWLSVCWFNTPLLALKKSFIFKTSLPQGSTAVCEVELDSWRANLQFSDLSSLLWLGLVHGDPQAALQLEVPWSHQTL